MKSAKLGIVCILSLILLQSPKALADEILQLVLKEDGAEPVLYHFQQGQSEPVRSEPLTREATTPLGSLWKLFVYVYLVDQRIPSSPYSCKGRDKDEIFCCPAGGRVERDEALYQSCGLYFSPDRLHLKASDWERYWVKERQVPLSWLSQLSRMKPETRVPIIDLITVLDALKRTGSTFRQTSEALAQTTLFGTAKGAYRKFGSLLRVKTYTWDSSSGSSALEGGFAGWLEGGTVIWARGSGTSHAVLDRWAPQILTLVNRTPPAQGPECVEVTFFRDYPLQKVLKFPESQAASPGPMSGRYRLLFTSGRSLDIDDAASLHLMQSEGRWQIRGRMSIQDYVARVLEREVALKPLEAARALSLVIRTYLYQNAETQGNCLRIDDSTRQQRVSPTRPGPASMQIARWSDRFIWDHVPGIRYHKTEDGKDRLSWKQAVRMALGGSRFDDILHAAYPKGRLTFQAQTRQPQCQRLAAAEAWLRQRAKVWNGRLLSVPGYQDPDAVKVCYSVSGAPYSLASEQTIFARFSGDVEDQLSLTHEYLHLAFQYHPNGANESLMESLARTLIFNPEQGVSHVTKNLDPAAGHAFQRTRPRAEY